MKRTVCGIVLTTAGLMLAAPAAADRDTDFTNEFHTHGIYGQRDYNAWIAKITCERLAKGVDSSAEQSAQFVYSNLKAGSTTEQAWQFLGAALRTYCPDQMPTLERVAAH